MRAFLELLLRILEALRRGPDGPPPSGPPA